MKKMVSNIKGITTWKAMVSTALEALLTSRDKCEKSRHGIRVLGEKYAKTEDVPGSKRVKLDMTLEE